MLIVRIEVILCRLVGFSLVTGGQIALFARRFQVVLDRLTSDVFPPLNRNEIRRNTENEKENTRPLVKRVLTPDAVRLWRGRVSNSNSFGTFLQFLSLFLSFFVFLSIWCL